MKISNSPCVNSSDSLDDAEQWAERTSIITKQDHAECIGYAKDFLKNLVDAAIRYAIKHRMNFNVEILIVSTAVRLKVCSSVPTQNENLLSLNQTLKISKMLNISKLICAHHGRAAQYKHNSFHNIL